MDAGEELYHVSVRLQPLSHLFPPNLNEQPKSRTKNNHRKKEPSNFVSEQQQTRKLMMKPKANMARDGESGLGVSPPEHTFQKAEILCLECKAITARSANSFWLWSR